MKLLTWMHRKLMQNSTEPMKNPTIGTATCFSAQTLSDEQNYYIEPTKKLPHSNIKFRKSSNNFEASKVEVLYQEDSFEPFDFLSIGTFGMELLNTDPPTPTLPMSIEQLTDQQIEITENDLNLINYELEKFLDAEETEINNDTISERSSQASIITLSYKPTEGADSEGHMHMAACPLQNYLFAASVDLPETDKEVKKERASLGELFKRNNIIHDDTPIKKCEEAEQQARKGNVAHFMKKVVKKFHSSSSSCTAASDNDATESNPTKKKLSKTLVKMFHKKVYPEEMTEKQFMKVSQGKKQNISNEDVHHKFDQSTSKKKSKKNTMKLSWAGICKGASPVNAGHWIKTDSDYLVLEL